jgi:hypothetical protein
MKVYVSNQSVTVILNGIEYEILTTEDTDSVLYDLDAICVLAGYRNAERALNRLVKHDCIGSATEWLEKGNVPDFIVRDLMRLAPCHYSAKLLRLFDERVFAENISSPESIKTRKTRHAELERNVAQSLEKVTNLEKQLTDANAELKTAMNEERTYYEENAVKECYEFTSDYETDYESTTDDESSDDPVCMDLDSDE